MIKELYRLNIIKIFPIGKEITLRSGSKSPFYIDLRGVVSFPTVFKKLISLYSEKVKAVDLIAGVPVGAIPIATGVSLNLNLPLIVPRKERKDYGLEKKIEGTFKPHQKVCLIEDIMTTGKSAFSSSCNLVSSGLEVEQIIPFIWYKKRECKAVTPLTTLEQVLGTLFVCKALDEETRDRIFRTLKGKHRNK